VFDTSVSNTYHYTKYMEKVLVLNSDYTPLNVTTMRRGFVLVDKGKAEVLKKDENPIITTIGNFVRPIIIRCQRHQDFSFTCLSKGRLCLCILWRSEKIND